MDLREFPRWMVIWMALAAIALVVLILLFVMAGVMANSGSGE